MRGLIKGKMEFNGSYSAIRRYIRNTKAKSGIEETEAA